jgi:hypothetical protein
MNFEEIGEVEGGMNIYGIFNRITRECIYVGSTDNYKQRCEYHKESYVKGNKLRAYIIMREEGDWDNFIFIPLEERSSHIGLNYVESIWWKTLNPRGNVYNPISG